MLLEVSNLKGGYGSKTVIHGVSLRVDRGEIVALFGHNGAGKTTTLKNIMGILKPTDGVVRYQERNIAGRSAITNVGDGITFIPQERIVFGPLSVQDNLELGAFTVNDKVKKAKSLETVYALFPILKDRRSQMAGTLSGGEQRMLSLGIGLMAQPKLLMLDEPSLGLSPLLVGKLMEAVQTITETTGTSVILVEQNVKQALRIARSVYVMKMGQIILEEARDKFAQRGQWWDLF